MVDNGAPARTLWLRQTLVLMGLAVAVWSAVRVARVLFDSGFDPGDSDPHGYLAIFSLVLIPFLVAALVALIRDAARLWRSTAPTRRVGAGVALVLSAPLAGQFTLVAFAVGGALVAVNIVDRRRGRS